MAGISSRPHSDGKSTTHQVRWREGGTRNGKQCYESFTTMAKAEQFRQMVEEAGETWPEGWVKGQGFLSQAEQAEREAAARPTVKAMLHRYIDQLTDAAPDTKSRYRRQATVMDEMLDKPTAADVTDEDVRHWINAFQRGPKTIHNYHGLLSAGYEWGVGKGLATVNPCKGSKLPREDVGIDEDSDEVHFLTEKEFALLLSCVHPDVYALVRMAVGTGLRYGELTALMPMDVDLEKKTLRVRRAWKKEGDNGERPKAVKMLMKHEVNRGHYLGPPKTRKSRRTVTLPDSIVELLREQMQGKAKDDFIFTTSARSTTSTNVRWAGGRAWNQIDFYEQRWKPAVDAAVEQGLERRPRFHDLRHTFAVWHITAGTDLKVLQQKLGHESIQTTSDRYGGFLPQSSTAADEAFDVALQGHTIRKLRAV